MQLVGSRNELNTRVESWPTRFSNAGLTFPDSPSQRNETLHFRLGIVWVCYLLVGYFTFPVIPRFDLLHLRLSFLQGVEVWPSLKRVAKLMLTPDSH